MDAVGNREVNRTPTVRMTVDEFGIAWLSMGNGSSRARVGRQCLRELEGWMDELEARIEASEVDTIVLVVESTAHHLDSYAVDEVAGMDEDEVTAWSREGQRILSRLERLSVPSVAAIEGTWLGSAAEMALACSYRVAANSPDAGIGFPQTSMDLLPAWGATVRIPRLTDIDGTLRVLLRGETLDPAAARGLGLIDRIVPAADFRARVARFALKKAHRDRGAPLSTRPVKTGILEASRGGRRLMLKRAARRYLSGPDAARAGASLRVTFELLARTEALPAERAFALEAAVAARVMTSVEARGRLHAEHCLACVSGQIAESAPVIQSAAVIGSNRTASDLAALLVAAGITVRMKDERRDLVSRGVATARARIEWERTNRRISAAEAERRVARLLPVTGYGGFGTLDLVISARKSVDAAGTALRDCLPHIGADCSLALHTWGALPSSSISGDDGSPEAIGLTLSLPADRFPLLEILAVPGTNPTSIAAIQRLGERLGLTTILVPPGSPSPGTRLVAAYFAEASRLLDEGATVVQVDHAAERFGFEVGPFRRMDAIGADRAHEIVGAIQGRSSMESPSARWLGRFARESRTFYTYRGGVPREPNPLLPPGLSPDKDTVEEMIQRRLMLALTGEAIRIVEAGQIDTAQLEVIALRALAYAPRRGGLLFQAQQTGYVALLTEFDAARARFGDRFVPPALLEEWAATHQTAGTDASSPDLDSVTG